MPRSKKEKTQPKKIKKTAKAQKPSSKKEEVSKKKTKEERYFEAVGRRKTAVARARLWPKGKGEFIVNGKPYQEYFPTLALQDTATSALKKMNCFEQFRTQILVKGGGVSAQAEAVRHATARALVLFNSEFKKRLRKAGYLTRDPRMKERKKFGLKRARRAPQWQKR